jgi:hypothetical protein
MKVIILPLSHSYMDLYLRFGVFILENIVFPRHDVDGYLSIFVVYYMHTVVRDSSVGIAIRYGLNGPGIESGWGRDFPQLSRTALGPTQPPIQWVLCLSRG